MIVMMIRNSNIDSHCHMSPAQGLDLMSGMQKKGAGLKKSQAGRGSTPLGAMVAFAQEVFGLADCQVGIC